MADHFALSSSSKYFFLWQILPFQFQHPFQQQVSRFQSLYTKDLYSFSQFELDLVWDLHAIIIQTRWLEYIKYYLLTSCKYVTLHNFNHENKIQSSFIFIFLNNFINLTFRKSSLTYKTKLHCLKKPLGDEIFTTLIQ